MPKNNHKKEKLDKPKKIKTEKPKRARKGTQYEKETSKGIVVLERTELPRHSLGAWKIVDHRSKSDKRD